MTIPVLSWRAKVLKTSLPSTTKLVLLALATHMNDHGEGCFPSIKLLMAECSLSNKAIITHIETARQAGWISVSKHGFAGRAWARNEYVISEPEGGEPGSPPIKKAVNVIPEGGERHAEKAVNDVHTNSSVNSPYNSSLAAPEKIKPQKRKTRIPPDWEIIEDDPNHLYAKSKGLSWEEMCVEEEKFKLYHEANGSGMVDWNKAFKKWILQSLQFKRPKYGNS